MTKKLTNDEYLLRVFNICGDEYAILEKYIDTRTNLLTIHNICGHKWKIAPNKFLLGRRCPKCGRKSSAYKNTTPMEKLKENILKISNNEIVIVDGQYINRNSKLIFYHRICKRKFEDEYENVLKRKSCLFCKKIRIFGKSHEKYVAEIFKKYNGEYIILGQYEKAKIHILTRHVPCGHEWMVTPTNLLRGFGCPKCNESKGERKISEFLNKNNIKFISQYKFVDCISKRKLPFDFYLSEYNICIEYDGELHSQIHRFIEKEIAIKKLEEQKERDLIKTNYCKDNKIKLIRVSYKYFNNIENILEKELERCI
jgi:predicted RNA-binding Zn-ribbon protein involved in translation (DUF1610 family)